MEPHARFSSDLFSYHNQVLPLEQEQKILATIQDLEKASENGDEAVKRRFCPYAAAPSVFNILSLGILFLGITAVVAGLISGDWETSFCVIVMLLILEAWIWLENFKIQEMKRSRCAYRGWNIGLGMNSRRMNRWLYARAGVGADGAILG